MPDFALSKDRTYFAAESILYLYFASPNTKYNYTEIIASASEDFDGFILYVNPVNPYLRALVDISIGASGSEQIIVNDFAGGSGVDADINSNRVDIPLSIKSGTRISARVQVSAQFQTVDIVIVPYKNGLSACSSFGKCTTYGQATSDSSGVSVTSGVDAYGSWTEITASTTEAIELLYLLMQSGSNLSIGSIKFYLQIGIGASGSEEILIDEQVCSLKGNVDIFLPENFTFDIRVPEGERLSIRLKKSSSSITADFIMYGIS